MTMMAGVLLLAAMAAPVDAQKARRAQAQEKPAENPAPEKPAETKPVELDKEEVNEARALAAGLPARERALLDALRFLTRPEFQEELLRGRKHRVCILEPLEVSKPGPMLITEALRLWAVLESGMPLSPPVEDQVRRLRTSPLAKPDNSLAEVAVHLAVLRAALSRPAMGERGLLLERAGELCKLMDSAKDACSTTSVHVVQGALMAPWFANQFWRALGLRCAAAMGVAVDGKQWSRDLDALGRAYSAPNGYTSQKNRAVYSVSLDLHSNLFSLAALALAASAPETLLSKSDIKAANSQLSRAPAILKRLQDTYVMGVGPFAGARLLPVVLMGQLAAPQGLTAGAWVASLTDAVTRSQGASGNFTATENLAKDLGLADSRIGNDPAGVAVETALLAVAFSGGPLEGAKPLANRGLMETGMAMHALALVEAAAARVYGGDPADMVNQAIDSGVAYLRTVQQPDGSFKGSHDNYCGQAALCLLAMLHGGLPRTDKSIVQGMAYLDSKKWMVSSYPYECGIMLMLLQKYFEKEAQEAGVLTAVTAEGYRRARQTLRSSLPADRVRLIDQLVKNLDASFSPSTDCYQYSPRNQAGNFGGDNSCTQYAMLGYRAASLLGAEVSAETFKREVRRLLENYQDYTKLKPVPYESEDSAGRKTGTRNTVQPGGWGYSPGKSLPVLQFAAAGVGTLALCLDELRLRGEMQPEMEDNIERRIHGALVFMAEKYVTTDSGIYDGIGSLEQSSDGSGAYYNLYSVERGCSLARVRMLNGAVDWYRLGANLLIDAQQDDGSWGRTGYMGRQTSPQLVNTCMAILFLKRASLPVLTEHRNREKNPPPQEPGKKEGPITGEPKKKE